MLLTQEKSNRQRWSNQCVSENMPTKQQWGRRSMLKRLSTEHESIRRTRYTPPQQFSKVRIRELIEDSPRSSGQSGQLSLIDSIIPHHAEDGAAVFVAGDAGILKQRCISVIGTRKITKDGAKRAARLAKELAEHEVVVVSGLAHGVDTYALRSAIESGGRVAAVIGTPLSQAYPASNSGLQEEIYRNHVLVSQFPEGARVYQSNFPARNRTMAFLSDASVIIEASDTSGTLHQAAECVKLGRWLCIANSVVEDTRLEWPKRFLSYEKCFVLNSTVELLTAVYGKK